jgi:hypothetical protein
MELLALDAPWLIGDWLNAAEMIGADDDLVACLNSDPRWEATTVAQWRYVASRFPESRRARRLPFPFFAAVAELPEAAADALLDLAVVEGWTLGTLTKQVASKKKEVRPHG